jgi:ATP-dependent Clp protease ATP-binding subunit ClpC
VFERFTESARQVVVLSQEEARLLGHNYIGTEHLLLGLLRQDDETVGAALGSHGLGIETARRCVVTIVGPGSKKASGQIPFTPRAKRVLELSLRESQGLGHNVIAPFHIALAIAREGGGVAAEIYAEHGLDQGELERVIGDVDPDLLAAAKDEDRVKQRLATVEARLTAWSRRGELMEIAATSPNAEEAQALVAAHLGLSPIRARDVLNMRLQHFTAAQVDALRAERDGLRARLDG